MRVSPDLRPEPPGKLVQSPQYGRIIELPQAALVLVGQSRERDRHLAEQPLELGEGLRVDFYPFVRDLNEGLAEIVVKRICFTIDAVKAPPKDGLQVLGRG
jgi:hypothetical protein